MVKKPSFMICSSRIARKRAVRSEAPVVAQRVLGPDLWILRTVLMPGARIEKAERLVAHLVHLAIEFDTHVVGVSMIGRDVMADDVAARPPYQPDFVLGEEV